MDIVELAKCGFDLVSKTRENMDFNRISQLRQQKLCRVDRHSDYIESYGQLKAAERDNAQYKLEAEWLECFTHMAYVIIIECNLNNIGIDNGVCQLVSSDTTWSMNWEDIVNSYYKYNMEDYDQFFEYKHKTLYSLDEVYYS